MNRVLDFFNICSSILLQEKQWVFERSLHLPRSHEVIDFVLQFAVQVLIVS